MNERLAVGGARRRSLVVAHLVLLASMLFHGVDHVRQGLDTLPPQVRSTGILLGILALAALPLTLRGHRRAPVAAAGVGFFIAALVVSGHIAPWGAFSYPEVGVDALSWAAMLSEVGAAVTLGAMGVALIRSSTRVTVDAPPRMQERGA